MRYFLGNRTVIEFRKSVQFWLTYNITRSTGTVHTSATVRTSAKARLTSAAIWRISMSSRFMSIDHFPYLPVVTNPENNPRIQMVIRIATEI